MTARHARNAPCDIRRAPAVAYTAPKRTAPTTLVAPSASIYPLSVGPNIRATRSVTIQRTKYTTNATTRTRASGVPGGRKARIGRVSGEVTIAKNASAWLCGDEISRANEDVERRGTRWPS